MANYTTESETEEERAEMSKREEWEEDHSQVSEFRSAVLSEFGKGLEKATPANVREFLDKFQEGRFQTKPKGRIELNETKTTYEEILKDFFVKVLEKPSDEALILLWTLAFELSFFQIEQHAAERLQALFSDNTDSTDFS
jgi:hypothetical protein